MTSAIYIASFNPISKGHVDVIEQSLRVFNKVYVCVANNSNKVYDISVSERILLVQQSIQEYFKPSLGDNLKDRITILNSTDKNISEVCDELNCYNIIRGLRAVSDYEYEAGLNLAYHQMNPKIQVVVFLANNKYMYVSSSIIREVYKVGSECKNLVPSCVHEFMNSKYNNKK